GGSVTVDPGVTATINTPVSTSGTLAKAGAGTLILNGANTSPNGTAVVGGILRVSSDTSLGVAPAAFTAGNISLDGGTLQFGASFDIANNRGITLAAGGGTIDTQSFGLSWAGAIYGAVATTTLAKIGSGNLRLNTNAANPSTFPGTLNVAAGTLQLNGGSAIGDLATINLANTPGVTLSITGGNETIGALSGGGASGGSVNLNTAAPLTLTT